jgi:branched-subunit amino acid transport protein AzlD
MFLTGTETIIIISMVTLGTVVTRFLPFILFKGSRGENPHINYLGTVLPFAAIGMLVIYCLKDVKFTAGNHGLPEIISIFSIALLHFWKGNTLLSIGAGTFLYMFLIQFIFGIVS